MKNVTSRIENTKLVIEVDISPAAIAQATRSASGKTLVIASTQGNVGVGNNLTLGLNLYTK